jgi:hypothetical protein
LEEATFLATGAAFLAGLAFFAGAGAFLAAGAVFLATGAAFLAPAADPLAGAGAGFRAADEAVAFLAAGATLFEVVADFFTTGFAFLLRAGRFLGAAVARPEEDLVPPPRDDVAAVGRDPDTFLAGVPLLAGVIVSSFRTT